MTGSSSSQHVPDENHPAAVTQAADDYLNTLNSEVLTFRARSVFVPTGHALQRNIYHYWFHTVAHHSAAWGMSPSWWAICRKPSTGPE
jgi:hypothetical protein